MGLYSRFLAVQHISDSKAAQSPEARIISHIWEPLIDDEIDLCLQCISIAFSWLGIFKVRPQTQAVAALCTFYIYMLYQAP